jgi:hypothetical protein
MKVVFLDIDGVLATSCSTEEGWNVTFDQQTSYGLDRICVGYLNELVELDVKFVLSSTWRIIHSLSWNEGFLKLHGFRGALLSKTPHDHQARRGKEIEKWLNNHPEVTHFAILDDDDDMEPFMHKLVRTTMKTGLGPSHIREIKKLLKV